ncbi:MAG: ABC transporter permease [Thermodesulfobacteriota bacterium]
MMRLIKRLFALTQYNRKIAVGGCCALIFITMALFSPLVYDYSRNVIKYDASNRFKAPNLSHFFGTDQYGRDVFVRVVWGTRTALYLAVCSVLIGLFIGVPYGMLSGYWGGWRDEFMMRINDALLSLPALMLALLIIATLGSSLENAIVAIGAAFVPRVARIMRSCAITIKNEQYVLAARARGESSYYIIFREILPNALGPMIVEGGIRMSYAVMVGTSLSFLGLGTQPPQPDWGLMIYEARQQIFLAPWTLIFPSVALTLMILSFNTLGDALRDTLDPKEKRLHQRNI